MLIRGRQFFGYWFKRTRSQFFGFVGWPKDISSTCFCACPDAPISFFFQCNKFQNTNSPRKNNLQILKIHVVDFLIQKCGLNFTEDEIFRMIGIIKTNAVHVEKPMFKEQKISGHVVYPTVSFMSHSCVSNARCW